MFCGESPCKPRIILQRLCACLLSTEGLEELVKQKGFLDGVYSFEYYPSTPGKYSIAVTWGGHHIPKR